MSMIFLRINLPNFLQFKQYQGLVPISFGGTASPTPKNIGGTAFPAFPLDYTTGFSIDLSISSFVDMKVNETMCENISLK